MNLNQALKLRHESDPPLGRTVTQDFGCVPESIVNVETLSDELREQLKLKARAQSDAIAGLPKSDATTLTSAENDAIAAAREVARSEIEVATRSRTEAHHALSNCRSALEEVRQARQDIEGETPPVARSMDALIEERDSEKAVYAAFKVNHKLERNATGDDRLVQVVWAAVVVAGESIFNAYFYMPISDLGLIGGFFTAFFVSLVNVGCAFLGGVLGLRYLSHIEPAKKLGGLIALLFFACACTLIVALSALFRGHADAMSAGELDTATLMDRAWQAAVYSLVDLEVLDLLASLHSFLLAFVGLLCAVVGFWKGWEFDDPYPGFGAAYRGKEKAQEAYDSACEEEDNRQRKWQRDHNQKLHDESRKLAGSKERMEANCAGFSQKIDSTPHLAEDTNSLAVALLSAYRQENIRVRATDPPAYFEDYDYANRFSDLDQGMQSIAKDLPDVKQKQSELVHECEAERVNIQAAIVGN